MNNSIFTLAFLLPGHTEWIVIGVIALLIFGKRLPDVARALGHSIVQFKRGINDVQDQIEDQSSAQPRRNPLGEIPPENKVKPLEPFDERLGGNEEELRRMQQQDDQYDERPADRGAAPTPPAT